MNNELEDTYINEHLIRNSTQSNRYVLQKTPYIPGPTTSNGIYSFELM